MSAFCAQCGQALGGEDAACPACGAATMQAADDINKTIMRPVRQPTPAITLNLVDGRTMELDGTILLGRNPRQQQGARSVAVPDRDSTVSKTHLEVAEDAGAVWVTDLQSTNGVRLAVADGSSVWLRPGEPTRVWPGTRVHYGSQSLLISGGASQSVPAPSGSPAPTVGPRAEPVLSSAPADQVPDAAGMESGSSMIRAVPVGTGDGQSARSISQPPNPVPPDPAQTNISPASASPTAPVPDAQRRSCPNCQTELMADDAFCMECGTALVGLTPADAVAGPDPQAMATEAVIGDISVAAGRVMTPVGSGPLSGSRWGLDEQVVDRTYIAQSTIIWAIVLSLFCGLGLLLLLKKEHEVTGTAVVSVATGTIQHRTFVQITSAADLAATREQVAALQRAAAPQS